MAHSLAMRLGQTSVSKKLHTIKQKQRKANEYTYTIHTYEHTQIIYTRTTPTHSLRLPPLRFQFLATTALHCICLLQWLFFRCYFPFTHSSPRLKIFSRSNSFANVLFATMLSCCWRNCLFMLVVVVPVCSAYCYFAMFLHNVHIYLCTRVYNMQSRKI